MSNIKPLYDRVVIKRVEEEKLSAGGIVIPDSATEKPIKGSVIAVGDGKALDNGTVRAPKVKVGDQVLFGKYSGTEVKLDGTDYLVVKEDDIFAILGLSRRAGFNPPTNLAICGTAGRDPPYNHLISGVKQHVRQRNPFR